jgi:protein-tyrosine phosphatase
MKKRAFLFMTVGAAACVAGFQNGHLGWPLAWFGVDFIIVGAAYFRHAHGVFGKCRDGRLPLWSWILFLPYLAYTSLVWHLIRLLSREPACNEVSPSLIVGRRLINGEFPNGIINYVDLTAEFQEPKQARRSPGYFSFPILDTSAPEPRRLKEIIASLKPGRTFVHCAQGHGRTGLFALATLLANRRVTSVDDGLRVLQTARPGIRLSREQRRCLDEFSLLMVPQGGAA